MAWDCRIGCRLNLFNVLILKVLLAQIYLVGLVSISNLTIVQSVFVDCDEVHHCICFKADGEDEYQIECPNKQLEVYPVTLKVNPWANRDKPGQGSLLITCDPQKPDFDWRLIRGLNLGKGNQGFTITKLTIQYCPVPPQNDSISELLKHLSIKAENITSFGFTSHRDLTTFPDYMLSPMTSLIDLNLGYNQLTTFPNLSFFPNLKFLNLHSNKLSVISNETFLNNRALKNFQITSNNLTHIEDRSLPDSLVYLSLVTNQISRVTNETFSNLLQLQQLYLNVNPLEDLDVYAFSSLTQLRDLRLDSSIIGHFPQLSSLPSLEYVSISYSRYFESNCRLLASSAEDPNQGVIMTTTVAADLGETSFANGSSGSGTSNNSPLISTPSPFSTNTNKSNQTLLSSSAAQSNFECVLKDLPSLITLNLINDSLQDIPVFENLPNLTSISLSKNKLRTLPLSAFAKVISLKRLDLSVNEINSISGIQTYQLVELDLSTNQIDTLDRSIFSYMGNLKKINLARNKIKYIDSKAFASLTLLEDLDLSENLITFPTPPPPGRESKFDSFYNGYSPFRSCIQIKNINLSKNQVSTMPNDFYSTLLGLRTLDLRYNNFTTLHATDFQFIQNEITVDLTYNQIAVIDMSYWFVFLDKSATNNVTIRLNYNPLNCNCSLLPFKLFNLASVKLEINELRCTGPESPKNISGLRFLEADKDDLVCAVNVDEGCPEECECWRRPSDSTIIINCEGRYNGTPAKFPNLNDIKIKRDSDSAKYEVLLDMSNNGIMSISDEYAKGLPTRVKGIDLRGNKLKSLSFLKAVGENNITRFNLSDNPFQCDDCEFLTNSRSQFLRIWDSDNLTCTVQDSSELKKALEFDYEDICSHKVMITILAPVLFIMLILFVVATYIYIRHGWAIRAFLYSKGFVQFLCDNNFEDDEEKIYDAFVSYSHQDETWVLEELVNRLEEQEGFKLCLHFRDWIPGDWIPDQIVRSVDQSRRTVVILSKNFVESVWSRLEFKAAHSQALSERSNRLILVLMGEDLTDSDVQDDDLRVYMKMNTYIKWNDPWFWHKLKYALPHRKCLIEENRNQYTKKVQRERAIQLDKIRTQMENQIQVVT